MAVEAGSEPVDNGNVGQSENTTDDEINHSVLAPSGVNEEVFPGSQTVRSDTPDLFYRENFY